MKKVIQILSFLVLLPFKMLFHLFTIFGKSKKITAQEYEIIDKKVESYLRSGKRVNISEWNLVRGNPRGSNPKYQDGSELQKLYVKIESNWQKKILDAAANKKEEFKKNLIEKYGESNALKILKKELWVGMDMGMVYEVKGKYDYKVENVINKTSQIILYYEKNRNRLGNDAYDFEITLEDGKVVGWKNRAHVGTRIK
jgi:hypothetical protein